MKALFIGVLLLLSGNSFAFHYFDKPIDYWREKAPPAPAPPLIREPKTVPPERAPFDWSKYQNPQNKEFFKEGDYTPPEPFMELARDPTDENIRNWFAVVDAKNKLMTALHERMSDYLKQNSSKLKEEERQSVTKQINRLNTPNADVKRFRFRLYFESSCPHCKNMITTISELRNQGYYIEVHQIDKERPQYPVPFPLIPTTVAELKSRKIESWPVLFVADTKRKLVYRINGYLSTADLMKTLSSK